MTDHTTDSELKVFQNKRIVASHSEKIKAEPKKIFPLLCPIQEYKWIDGWKCEMVYSQSGGIEKHCIFYEEKTGPILFNHEAPTYWLVSQYEPLDFRLQFIHHTVGMFVSQMDLTVEELSDGESSVNWSFTITALNEEANSLIDANTEHKAKMYLTIVGKSLKHYCETGEMLKLNKANILKWGVSARISQLLKAHFK